MIPVPIRAGVLIWMAAVYALSSIEGGLGSGGFNVILPEHFDKLVHAIIYSMLMPLLRPPIPYAVRAPGWKPFTWGVAVTFAMCDELHQSFTPERSPAFADFLADVIGIALGSWLSTASWLTRIDRPIL